jgi:hypothetical protein
VGLGHASEVARDASSDVGYTPRISQLVPLGASVEAPGFRNPSEKLTIIGMPSQGTSTSMSASSPPLNSLSTAPRRAAPSSNSTPPPELKQTLGTLISHRSVLGYLVLS